MQILERFYDSPWLTNNCYYAKTFPCAKSNTSSKVLLRSVHSATSLLMINAVRNQYLYIISSKKSPTPCIVTILYLALQKQHTKTTNMYTYNDFSSYCLISNISIIFLADFQHCGSQMACLVKFKIKLIVFNYKRKCPSNMSVTKLKWV